MMDKEAGRQCLLEAAGILEKLEVLYFLIQGTALGAYRDKGFTPTEADIDFGFLQEHFGPRAGDVAKAFIEAGFDVRSFSLPFSRCRLLVVQRYGVKIDMVSYLLWKDKRFAATPVHPSVPDRYCIVHHRNMLETYELIGLFGHGFRVPSPVEEYLRLEYGDDWRTPREDHVSRTRVYGFLEKEGIPSDLLDT